MFSELQISDWRQYGHVDLHFHPRLTVLTGANGSGKTTLLNLLSRHFGWNLNLVSSPRFDKTRALKWFSGAGLQSERSGIPSTIGYLTYSAGDPCAITIPQDVEAQYQPSIAGQQPVPGVYLTSHRPVFTYQAVQDIPVNVSARDQLFEQYLSNLRSFWGAGQRVESPAMRLKRALISMATFGYGNEVVEGNVESREAFEGFEKVLRTVLPESLGFERLIVRIPEIVLSTRSGEFALDASSGGVAALIDISWQIHMRAMQGEEFVVVADEPENHLHPTLQRNLMPRLLDAFPSAQFVVATHNPFVVSSVRDSHVYALQYRGNRIESELLDLIDKAGSSNDILREVLGVPVPLPEWVEDEIGEIVSDYAPDQIGEQALRQIRDRLEEVGLDRHFAEVLDRVLNPASGNA